MNDALRNEEDRQNNREREQNVYRAADQIRPEVTDRSGGFSNETADKGGERCHTGGRGYKVLYGQPQHLRQITHGRFAAISLPVGVAGKTYGGIERGIRRYGAKPMWIEPQPILPSLQGIDGEQPRKIEQQQRKGILLPVHLIVGSYSAQPIQPSLEHRSETTEGMTLVDFGHVLTQRLCQYDQHDQVKNKLKDAVCRH